VALLGWFYPANGSNTHLSGVSPARRLSVRRGQKSVEDMVLLWTKVGNITAHGIWHFRVLDNLPYDIQVAKHHTADVEPDPSEFVQ
jgi:hypothetical protein